MFLAQEARGPLPSFFEVFMQDRITQSLRPALKHVITVMMERYPVAVLLLERFDEVYAILAFLVERQYLQRTDALFAESLYGLKRSRLLRDGQLVDLTDRDRRRALLFTVLVPYLKCKLDSLHARWTADRAPPSSLSSSRSRGWRTAVRDLFVAAYPFMHASYEGVFFFYNWAYLLGLRKHYSPLLELSGTVARRITREDIERRQAADLAAASSQSWGPSGITYLKAAFVLAVISFKVMEWLHHSAPALAPQSSGDGRVPPVPDRPLPAVGGLPLPKDPSTCPLCQNLRVNPAVSPAGIAFCYRCLVTHVRDHGNCPVTLQSCREEQIRRLYIS